MNRQAPERRGAKWQAGGRSLVMRIRADRVARDIARHAPRPDDHGWHRCAGCRQSCTGSYAGKPGCVRCGIVSGAHG